MTQPLLRENSAYSKEFILGLNYPDFVGFINQWNVLPGAHVTLSKWINFANITRDSNTLQFACTTGFQSREIAMRTGCRAKAFDLSPYAIEAAKYNQKHYASNSRVEYFCADGHEYSSEEKFSHVLIGAGLKFFKDPGRTFGKCVSFLEEGGHFLASPFYIVKDIPPELIEKARDVFGITPTIEGYKQIMSPYQSLEIIYEDKNFIESETEEELRKYCQSTIDRACVINGIESEELYQVMFDRLYAVKEMSNLLRPYQEYSVLALRYRKNVYPHRYVELF